MRRTLVLPEPAETIIVMTDGGATVKRKDVLQPGPLGSLGWRIYGGQCDRGMPRPGRGSRNPKKPLRSADDDMPGITMHASEAMYWCFS